MASTLDWKQWTFNFYYGEELRSLYMNGVLLEGFRPGVYNANILFYVNEADPSNKTFHFIIKRGTTLIFSNNYRCVGPKDNGGVVERDFFNIGKETFAADDQYSYLIKCVANEDVYISSNEWIQGSSYFGTQQFIDSLYRGRDIYIFARVYYAAKNSGTATNNSYPNVDIVPYFLETIPYESIRSTRGRYRPISAEASVREEDYITSPPDGMLYSEFVNKCNTTSSWLRYSFLNLGILRYTGTKDRDFSSVAKFSSEDFVFTGRGLPEYRQSMSPTVSVLTPDFFVAGKYIPSETEEGINVFDSKLNTLYLDIPAIVCDDVYYNNSVENISRSLTCQDAFITGDVIDLPSLKCSVPIVNPEDRTLDFTNGDYRLYVDLFYLHTSKNYSNSERNRALRDVLMNSSWEQGKKPDPDKFDDFEVDYELKFSVENFELRESNDWSQDLRRNNLTLDYKQTASLDPGCDNEIIDAYVNIPDINKPTFFVHNLFDLDTEDSVLNYVSKESSDAYYGRIVPLDVSIANTQRLYNIIKNKPIIPMMIDYIRQNKDDATNYSTIIPVALAFRKYVAKGSKKGWVGLVPQRDTINPANILSLLDMQFRETKAYAITIKNSDVYNTLSVIE